MLERAQGRAALLTVLLLGWHIAEVFPVAVQLGHQCSGTWQESGAWGRSEVPLSQLRLQALRFFCAVNCVWLRLCLPARTHRMLHHLHLQTWCNHIPPSECIFRRLFVQYSWSLHLQSLLYRETVAETSQGIPLPWNSLRIRFEGLRAITVPETKADTVQIICATHNQRASQI